MLLNEFWLVLLSLLSDWEVSYQCTQETKNHSFPLGANWNEYRRQIRKDSFEKTSNKNDHKLISTFIFLWFTFFAVFGKCRIFQENCFSSEVVTRDYYFGMFFKEEDSIMIVSPTDILVHQNWRSSRCYNISGSRFLFFKFRYMKNEC